MEQEGSYSAVLLLEDGEVFYGHAVGKNGTATGEICFNTGMTGYQEIFTDPSYFGQIMVSTNVHIGNYGTLDDDEQSERVQISGLVCKTFSKDFSRELSKSSIQKYFEKEGVLGIEGIDTRSIVRHIRNKGAMNAIISSEELDLDKLRKRLHDTPSMDGLELASKVSTKQAYYVGDPSSNLKISVLDFGTKRNILECFAQRGAFLKIFPAQSSFEEMKEWNPNGYFLSNGPGDPSSMDYAIRTAKKIIESGTPTFGICLGHQILALAEGLSTYKMHHGHRGINHPVKNLISGKCEVTSQNHGFGVHADAIASKKESIEVTHINLNDNTVEGLKLKARPVFPVQFHPEAAPGPHDSRYLFDNFIQLMTEYKK